MTSAWIVQLLLVIFFQDINGLKNVQLSIEPTVVQRHDHAILHCHYDLEDAPLYSVKWYRGPHEFYRFTPADHPATKIFPFAGITVDVNHSNSTQVYLQNIEFNLSGLFSCEVTTDEPLLSGTDTQAMLVVQLPENPPTISVGHEPLDYGDVLKANCSSPPAKPPALLKFTLNNITVARTEPMSQRKASEPVWSDLSLELPLSEFHFRTGKLVLSCVAQIADVYLRDATLELQSARNPVPERVSAVDAANSLSNYIVLQWITFIVLLFVSS